jgi:polar amino acid transport system substrate-binding protein
MKKVLSLIAAMCIVLAGLAACAAPAATTAAPVATTAAPAAPAATDVPTVAPTTGPADGLPATIAVGVNSQNPPWVYMDNGTMTGLEVDIMNEFAKREGIKVDYKSAPFATVLTGVQSGQWDVAMSSIWVTADRMTMMDFVHPYYDAQIGMITNKTGGVMSVTDMKGKSFGADTGSANETWLKDNQTKYGPYTMKSYNGWMDAVLDLQAGRLDGVVADAPTGLYYLQQHSDSVLTLSFYMSDFHFAQAMAFKKASPITAVFNKVQDEMVKDGTMKAIVEKWLGPNLPPESCAIVICEPYLPNEKPTVTP